MIRHIAEGVLWVSLAWGVYYAGFRWNESDEDFLHRGGRCTGTKKSCADFSRVDG